MELKTYVLFLDLVNTSQPSRWLNAISSEEVCIQTINLQTLHRLNRWSVHSSSSLFKRVAVKCRLAVHRLLVRCQILRQRSPYDPAAAKLSGNLSALVKVFVIKACWEQYHLVKDAYRLAQSLFPQAQVILVVPKSEKVNYMSLFRKAHGTVHIFCQQNGLATNDEFRARLSGRQVTAIAAKSGIK